MIHTFFRKFGLTDNEREIYIFLLAYGPSVASMIGKRLNIKRVTVYAALEGLNKKGLILSYQKNNVTYFEPAPPETIVNICEEQMTEMHNLQKESQKMLSILKNLESTQHKPLLEVKGKISYYQGIDGVKRLIDETLNENSKEQLCFGLNTYHIQHPSDVWKQYTKKRISIGMKVRSIQPDSKEAQEYKKRDKEELRITRLVPADQFPSGGCELNIIGDMIALFTIEGNEPAGMKMYNKNMARVLRSLFELAWERASLD